MRISGNNTSPKQLTGLLKKGEGQTLELKRSTAELQGAMQALCAFMNGAGGMVIIGVGPDGRLLGQDVSDATQQKIAAALDRFEAALPIFEERQGFLIVTFKAPIAEAAEKTSKEPVTAPESTQSPTQSATHSNDPVYRLLAVLQKGELSSSQLREAYGMRDQE